MVKIVLTRKSDGVVTNIVNTSSTVSNGLLVSDANGQYIIASIENYNVYENVETSEDIMPGKYKYTSEGGFIIDPTFKPYIPLEQQVSNLQTSLLETQNALNTLMGV